MNLFLVAQSKNFFDKKKTKGKTKRRQRSQIQIKTLLCANCSVRSIFWYLNHVERNFCLTKKLAAKWRRRRRLRLLIKQQTHGGNNLLNVVDFVSFIYIHDSFSEQIWAESTSVVVTEESKAVVVHLWRSLNVSCFRTVYGSFQFNHKSF